MAVIWTEATPAVLDLAQRIIERYHERLRGARIVFVMRSEAPSSNGRVTMGKAKKVSAEMQLHIDADFLIWLALDEWLRLSAMQREALVDHELSHCHWDGMAASMRGHDVEEFDHILARYGAWWPASDSFTLAVQLGLPIIRRDEQQGSVGTINFDKIAREVAEGMTGEGVEVEYRAAASRED